jgi:predicted alpha/beta superfamily hydrolase
MDGDDQFKYAVAAYQAARKAKSVQPLVLVGVGYGASYGQPGNYRARDYTPSEMKTEGETGKAKEFSAFLEKTLWPELAKRYSLKEEARGLGGHSLGSLLAVANLFYGSGFFDRILASSPSLWWQDRSVFGDIKALHEKKKTLKARLYLSVGLKDSESMTGDLERLKQLLLDTPFKGLDVIAHTFADKDHYNVLPDSFQAGLSALYQ